MEITGVRHAYPECDGFCMDRKSGYHGDYTFLHFHNSMEVVQNGRLIRTQPHAMILYEPEVPQFFRSCGPLIHDWMHLRGDGRELTETTGLKCNEICYPSHPAFITELTAEIESEFFGSKPNRDRLLTLKVEELFLKIGRALTEQSAEPQSEGLLQKLRLLRGQVFMSLDEKWTVARMAEQVFLSESRFYTLYKSCFGISPLADLINAKMNSARNMLVVSQKSVDEIAFSLGYQNTTHFIRQFKEHNGTTPAKYRRENR